jgi:hypothetical protein
MKDPVTQIQEPVPAQVVNIVHSVLGVKAIALPDILDYHGISSVATPMEEADNLNEDRVVAGTGPQSSEEPDNASPQALAPGSQSDSGDSRDLGTDTPPSSVYSPPATLASRNEEDSYFGVSSRPVASQPGNQLINAFTSRSDYYPGLLRKVVATARRTTFPSRGPFDMSAIRAALLSVSPEEEPVWEPYRVRSTSQLERDRQVGAAGELFVSVFN